MTAFESCAITPGRSRIRCAAMRLGMRLRDAADMVGARRRLGQAGCDLPERGSYLDKAGGLASIGPPTCGARKSVRAILPWRIR
jgi:hypothetical protein